MKTVVADACAVYEKIDRSSLCDIPYHRFDLGCCEQIKFDLVERSMLNYVSTRREVSADSVDFVVHIEESLTDCFSDSGGSSGDDCSLCHCLSLTCFTI